MKLNEVLDELVIKNRPISQYGNVANYIPELDKAPKDALGIFIIQNSLYKVYLK